MSGPPALVPTSPWFGDGSDGELVITADYPIEVQEDIGHIFKQYTSLHIQSGGTLRPSARCAGMVILVQGDCTIDAGGSINMDKMAPRRSDDTEAAILTTGPSAPWLQKISGLVGGAGGAGGAAERGGGKGGAGGSGHRFGGGYGGGGAGGRLFSNSSGSRSYAGGSSEPRPPVDITWPYPGTTGEAASYGAGSGYYPTYGGAAPGGSGGSESAYNTSTDQIYRYPGAAGDAYGGGLLMLVVGGTLKIHGKITANGGNGADVTGAAYGMPGGGGGGGGGVLAILYKNIDVIQGSVSVVGGVGGRWPMNPYDECTGKDGSTGTTHISQVDDELNEVLRGLQCLLEKSTTIKQRARCLNTI